jgi:hypothetical protein
MFASKTIPLRYRPPHIIAMLYHVEIINRITLTPSRGKSLWKSNSSHSAVQLIALNNTIIITVTV